MREHITHHDDCGCLSERYQVRIAALRAALEALLDATHEWCSLPGLLAEASGRGHWHDQPREAERASSAIFRAVEDARARAFDALEADEEGQL